MGRSWCGGPGQRNPQEIYPVRGQNFTLREKVFFLKRYSSMKSTGSGETLFFKILKWKKKILTFKSFSG
jgi:hypothetical protein